MEDEAREPQSSERQQVEGGTLSKLADIRLGPVSLNLRILLEPIGFLRIILLVLSIFAFSLTAGYMSAGDSSRTSCTNTTNFNVTVFASFQYPYDVSSFRYNYPDGPPSTTLCTGPIAGAGNHALSGSCQFFVGMGVLTFLYCLVILPVYVFVYTIKLDFSKYVAIVDCCVSIGATVLYAFANIAWSAGTTDLRGYIADNLRSRVTSCLNCTLSSMELAALQVDVQGTTQLSFSLLFGWIMMVVWGVTIWFSYKETIIHIKRMGPQYALVSQLIYKVKGGKPPSQGGGGEEETDPGSD